MGMYDTLRFACPKCGEALGLQSKEGACILDTFSVNEVPWPIARHLDRQITRCACGAVLQVRIVGPVVMDVFAPLED